MSRLVDLYSDDGRVVVGRSSVPFPVSVGVGYAIVSPVITGFTPITTQIQTGWVNKRGSFFPLGVTNTRKLKPVYQTVTTGYTPIYSAPFYSPAFVGIIPFGIY